MKKITLTLLAILFSVCIFATKITAVLSSNWNSTSTWDLHRLPATNDSIYIPGGITVQLQNTVNLNNIFLSISGTLDMDNGRLFLDNSSDIVMKSSGYILSQSNNEMIKIGNTIKLKGNGNNYMVGGPSFANSTTGNYPNGFLVLSALPVTFGSFDLAKADNNVVVKWSTAQEFNNDNFEVQRSADGNSWTVISVVKGMGTSNTTTQYAFTDKAMKAAVAYYRIRQVDLDGKSVYSAIKKISGIETIKAAKIYAAGTSIKIELNAEFKNYLSVRLFNCDGQLVAQVSKQPNSYIITVDNMNVNKGIYIVQVADAQGWMQSAKIIL
jgi:hypothetical protein